MKLIVLPLLFMFAFAIPYCIAGHRRYRHFQARVKWREQNLQFWYQQKMDTHNLVVRLHHQGNAEAEERAIYSYGVAVLRYNKELQEAMQELR